MKIDRGLQAASVRRGRHSSLARVLYAASCGLAALCLSGTTWAQERVEIGSPEELLEFFETIDYTPEA
jgi:hypothetical protein